LSVPLGTSTFTLPTKVASGGTYAVAIQQQPTGLTCQLVNASGPVSTGAITNIEVICGQWSWQSGADTTGAAGVYGTQHMGASGNTPGARAAASVSRDSSGNLWLFGGDGAQGDLNDLWQYSPGSIEWTWVSGATTAKASGNYGAQGSAAPTNVPGARESAVSWIDHSGDLWLFGGEGYDSAGTRGALNDLWEYQASTQDWIWISGAASAWMAGSTPPTGAPAARSGAVSWIDTSGNLWLFGGTGTDGLLNDLWEFTPGTGWAFVSGSQTNNANGTYGTAGTAATGNAPGGRSQAVSWVDRSGNLWLFGGSGYGSIGGSGLLNDLWEFDPGTMQWTWINGSQTVNSEGIFGTQTATANSPKVPGGRYGASAASDTAGNLWLFGGTGYDSARTLGALNDLWQYNLIAGQWIWMSGSQTTGAIGSYGTENVAAPGNTPGERSAPSAWIDSAGDFWLFGGDGWAATKTTGMLNDLWEFTQ
jgi:N-acetylneuraminic acid mutarotase